MKVADVEKQIRSYLSAVVLVHVTATSLDLSESVGIKSKYTYSLEDVLKAVDRANKAFSYIDKNEVRGIFTDEVKENLLSLIDVAIAKIGDVIDFLHSVECENRSDVLTKVSKLIDDMDLLRGIIVGK